MNVLLIGGDHTLISDEAVVPSNTKERMILIGKDVSNLTIARLSPESNEKKIIKLSDKVIVYSVPSQGKNPITSIMKAYQGCSNLFGENKFDVISASSPFIPGIVGYLLKLRYKTPLNIQVHGDFIDNEWWLNQNKTHYIWNNVAKWILRKADTVRTVNDEISYKIKNMGIAQEKVFNFPVFIDIQKFGSNKPEFKIDLNGFEPNEFEGLTLFVGFLIKRKAVDILLKAAKIVLDKYPKTIFVIIGDGPERGNLEQLSAKLGISDRLIFKGELAHDVLPGYYNLSNILVLPSRSESWGRVIIESLVFEKPVIVSDSCKITKVPSFDRFGLKFQVDNPKSLANKIIFLLENQDLAKEMGKNGQKVVINNYSWKVLAKEYLNLWKKTMKV